MITKSNINGLSTLKNTFPSLLQAKMTGYSTSTNKVDGKPTIYCINSDSFKMAKKSQHAWSLGSHILPLVEISFCFYVNQFNVFLSSEGNTLLRYRSKWLYCENNLNFGFDLIKKYVTVEFYFITYPDLLDLLTSFM